MIIPNFTSDKSYQGKVYGDMRSFSGGNNLAGRSRKAEKRLSGLPPLPRWAVYSTSSRGVLKVYWFGDTGEFFMIGERVEDVHLFMTYCFLYAKICAVLSPRPELVSDRT